MHFGELFTERGCPIRDKICLIRDEICLIRHIKNDIIAYLGENLGLLKNLFQTSKKCTSSNPS